MLGLILTASLWVLGLGMAIKLITDDLKLIKNITWVEYVGFGLLFCLVIAPLSTAIGWNSQKQSRLERLENWHGSELQTVVTKVNCTKDGPCKWEYDCDSYQCNPHDCNCSCTSRNDDGSCASESCSTCYDTCYHDCPYCNTEYHYSTITSLRVYKSDGSYTLQAFANATYRLPENPQANRWVSTFDKFEYEYGRAIPERIINKAGVGPPQDWLDTQYRLQIGNPGPVTVNNRIYENPIYASDNHTFTNLAPLRAELEARNLLPSPVVEVFSPYGYGPAYLVSEVLFVGFTPNEIETYQRQHQRLNAAVGSEVYGDLRTIIIKDDFALANADQYVYALKSYWTDENLWDDYVASKNTIMLVLFTVDETTIADAKMITGMPFGNEYLIQRVSALIGTTINPYVLFGNVTGEVYIREDKNPPIPAIEYEHEDPGAVEDLIFGISDPNTKFFRESMSETLGHLWKEAVPTDAQKGAVRNWSIFLGMLCWVAALFIGERRRTQSYSSRYTYQ